MAMSVGSAIFLFLFIVAFVVTTIVVIVLVCLDWCTRHPQTETVHPGLSFTFSPDQTPPGNILTLSPGQEPTANLAWRRSGALAWMAFELDFPIQVTPTTGVTELKFTTLEFEIASDRLPRMKCIEREDTIFTAVGTTFVDEGKEVKETAAEIVCVIDVQRQPATVVRIIVKEVTLPVDANGTTMFRCIGNLVYPVKGYGCCEICCAPNTDGYQAQHAKFN